MAFPTNGVQDNFNRANQTPLGGNWSGKIRSADQDLSINGNQAHANTAGTGSAVWSPPTPIGDDQESYLTASTTASVSDPMEAWCRVTNTGGTTPDGYLARFTDNGGASDTVQLFRCDNGTFTQIGATFTGTVGTGGKWGIEANGSAIKGYTGSGSTWTQRISTTDATYTTGKAAITSNANPSCDDFGGGTIIPPTEPSVNPDYTDFPKFILSGRSPI